LQRRGKHGGDADKEKVGKVIADYDKMPWSAFVAVYDADDFGEAVLRAIEGGGE
jgi:hypothetical protein